MTKFTEFSSGRYVELAQVELALEGLGYKRVPGSGAHLLWQRNDPSGPQFLTFSPPTSDAGFDQPVYHRDYVVDVLQAVGSSLVITPAEAVESADQAVDSAWERDWRSLGQDLARVVGRSHKRHTTRVRG